jgi:F420 biosynthesis protein FbiB-like protein
MGADFRRDLLADGLSPVDVDAQVERSRHRILEVPAALLLCLDESEMDQYPDQLRQEAEHLMAVQGVAMAGQNLLLAAHGEGRGSVWMCAPLFAPQAVRRALSLPEAWQPQGLVLLGYPAKAPLVQEKGSLPDITLFR